MSFCMSQGVPQARNRVFSVGADTPYTVNHLVSAMVRVAIAGNPASVEGQAP